MKRGRKPGAPASMRSQSKAIKSPRALLRKSAQSIEDDLPAFDAVRDSLVNEFLGGPSAPKAVPRQTRRAHS